MNAKNTSRGEYLEMLMDSWVRAERGRSVGQALKTLGITHTAWGKWKKGGAMRPNNAAALAGFFGVSVDDIVTGGNADASAKARAAIMQAIEAVDLVEDRLGLDLTKEKRRTLIERFASDDAELEPLANRIQAHLLEGLQT